jgi:hypothetical protein
MTRQISLESIAEADARYAKQVLAKNAALRDAEAFSLEKLNLLREVIARDPPPNVHVLVTAGSMARREASAQSDLDLIITTDLSRHSVDEALVCEWRSSLCKKLQFEEPNARGVFIKPVDIKNLTTNSGDSEEQYDQVAKRILFILESTWLYQEDEYEILLRRIVDIYAEDVRQDPKKNFVYLLNDVVRFFRALCVNYQHTKSATEFGKWPIRNTKLRHSRVIMYFSMISAIGLLSRYDGADKIDMLVSLIKLPPLRRLAVAYELSGDRAFFKVAQFYNQFLAVLSNGDNRKELRDLEYASRYDSRTFAQLKANSDGLSSELLRFFEARRRDWDDRFFEYMIL